MFLASIAPYFLALFIAVPAAGASGKLPHADQAMTPAAQTAAFNKCGSVCQLGGRGY